MANQPPLAKTSLVEVMALLTEINQKLDQLIQVRSGNSLSGNNALVTALLQCDTVANNLDTLKGDLPSKISSKVSTSSSTLIQVVELVRACNQYGAVQELVEALRFYEQDSMAFQAVERMATCPKELK